MRLYSAVIVMLLSVCIASTTTFLFILVSPLQANTLAIVFLLPLISSYLFIWPTLKSLFFRQIDNVRKHLDKIGNGGQTFSKKKKAANPFRGISEEISDYVTKKQEEIEQLKQLENFRKEFIANVSHELKTPVFAAQGFVHTLLDGAIHDKSVRKKFLKKAAKSLDRLDLLVQDILTISQIESGEIKMNFENFDMVTLCHEVLDQLEGKAEKKGITLELPEKYSSSIIVRGDCQRIYQVMINLISNAIKYTRKKGWAKVSLKEVNGKIRTTVKDNGRGIPESDLNRIFERFYRVEKSRSREKGGTGLGLSIVKHILEGHHSAIIVESKLRVGSKFYFDLEKAAYIDRISEKEYDEEEEHTQQAMKVPF